MRKTSMVDFIKSEKTATVIDMKNPRCNNCNDCCSMGTPLSTDEYNQIRKFFRTKQGNIIYAEAVHRIKKHTTKDTIYWLCPLSTSTRKCSIYSLRPAICKDFHCSPSLVKIGYDKKEYGDKEKYIIYDLFNKRRNND